MKAEDDERLIESVLERNKAPVVEQTTYTEFEEAIQGDDRTQKLDEATRRYIFERVSDGGPASRAGTLCSRVCTRVIVVARASDSSRQGREAKS